MILDFHFPELEEYDTVHPYLAEYGEGSCQHSFVTMYTLHEKYGDQICIQDSFVYTLRSHMCDDQYRVYLAPLGSGDREAAFRNILEDAHRFGKKAKFFSLTPSAAEFLQTHFPEQFDYQEDRDLAEYMYSTAVMSELSGSALVKRRREAHKFWSTYGDRATVKPITKQDHPEIIAFEVQWLQQNMEHHDTFALEREAKAIRQQLQYFDELHLSGVVLRLDEIVRGFGYGTPLSDTFYDALIEKADKDLLFPYRVLRMESVKQCAMSQTYVNMEEDVGVEGLRQLKLAYKPDYLLHKYVVTEK